MVMKILLSGLGLYIIYEQSFHDEFSSPFLV